MFYYKLVINVKLKKPYISTGGIGQDYNDKILEVRETFRSKDYENQSNELVYQVE